MNAVLFLAFWLAGGVDPRGIVWAQPEHYPQGARIAGAEGDVGLRIEFTPSGHARSCRVVESSGDPWLDGESCRIVGRSRIYAIMPPPPAKGVDLVIRWRLPSPSAVAYYDGAAPIAPDFWVRPTNRLTLSSIRPGRLKPVTVRFEISEEGRAENCLVVGSSGHDGLDRESCALLIERATFLPARDGNGTPRRASGETVFDWRR